MTSTRNYLFAVSSCHPVLILPLSPKHSLHRGRKAKERPAPGISSCSSDPAAEGRADSLAGGTAQVCKIHQNRSKRTREPKIAPQTLLWAALGTLPGEVSAPVHQQGLPQDFSPAALPNCCLQHTHTSHLGFLRKQKSLCTEHLRSTLGFTNCWRIQDKSA